MGLDMYLERMPRYREIGNIPDVGELALAPIEYFKEATAQDVNAVQNYLSWTKAKEEGSRYANCTFEEWCGIEKIPSQKYIVFYAPFYTKKYSYWDVNHEYGYYQIAEPVGYWRKANQIHNWFVENIQDGIDDCQYHRKITKEDLEELLDTCKKVLEHCKIVEGKVCTGWDEEDGKRVYNMEDGIYIQDTSVAEELLPTTNGFFFGGTDYDEWYIKDIKDTIKIITEVLKTTDFETQMIYYLASW